MSNLGEDLQKPANLKTYSYNPAGLFILLSKVSIVGVMAYIGINPLPIHFRLA